MTTQERLEKAIGGIHPMSQDLLAQHILRRDPQLAADLELGAAWRAVEEVLPEGGWIESFGPAIDSGGFGALAHARDNTVIDAGTGPTPTVALLALAAKLREAK